MLVDSHCHLTYPPLADAVDAVIAEAAAAGVGKLLAISVKAEEFPALCALAVAHENVFISAGIHPNERGGAEPDADELAEMARAPKVAAVGETGLDYFRSQGDLDWQRQRFDRHIAAAQAAGKPLVIHTRESMDDTLAVLEAATHGGGLGAGGVMHCFTGDWAQARRALDIGFYLSFSGIVTFKNAAAVQEVARKAPSERILVETDAPFLAPVPHRGKPNRPAWVRHVAARLAELRGADLEQIAEVTTANFHRLFTLAAD